MNIQKELTKVGTFLVDSDVLDNISEKIIANFIWYVAKKLNYTKQIIDLEDKLLAFPDYSTDGYYDVFILYNLNADLGQVALGNK